MSAIVFTNDTLTFKVVKVGSEFTKHRAMATNENDVLVTAIICFILLLAIIIVTNVALKYYKIKHNVENKGKTNGKTVDTSSEKEDKARRIEWEKEDRARRIEWENEDRTRRFLSEDARAKRKIELENNVLEYIKAMTEKGKLETNDPYVAEINAILGIPKGYKSVDNKQSTP